jgi:hypothetical protein
MFSGTNEFPKIQWKHLANKDTFCYSVCGPFWCSPLSFLIHAIVFVNNPIIPHVIFVGVPFHALSMGENIILDSIPPLVHVVLHYPFIPWKQTYIYILWFHPNTLPLVLVPFHAHLSFEFLFSHILVSCHSSWCSLLFSSSPIIFHCELVVPHHPLMVVCHSMLSFIAILIFYVIIGTKLKHPQIL